MSDAVLVTGAFGLVGSAVVTALAAGGRPVVATDLGVPGNPDDDTAWFATDWMDTNRSQEALRFQHHSWPQLLADTRASAGSKRFPIGLAAPLIRAFLRSKSADKDHPGRLADPWNAIDKKWGDHRPDRADEAKG